MTVTTRDVERVTTRAKAELDALIACAPAHADLIANAALARLQRDLGASGAGGRVTLPHGAAAPRRRAGAGP